MFEVRRDHKAYWTGRFLYGACSCVSALISIALTGCAVHQTGHEKPVEPPGQFSVNGSTPIPDRWWQAFEDPTLNRLQVQAIRGNFDLKAARDRLEAARAVVDRETAFQFPVLDLSASAERVERESNDFEGTDQFTGTLAAGYEVDLWKRIDSAVKRAELEKTAVRNDLEAAAITLTANIASTWYELVQQRGQRAILKKQIETNENVLKIIRKRFGKGLVRASDVLRQERLLESTHEQLERVRSIIEILKHQLAVLLGHSPTESIQAKGSQLPKIPPIPDTGLPSELVHRRPDVRSAFYRLRAADRTVAIAIADRYPQLTLSASGSVSDEEVTSIFDDWARSIAADLTAPLVDFGERKAEVQRTKSVKQQRIHQYGQTVLTAFREVEDTLSQEGHQKKQIKRINNQLNLAQRTFQRLRRQYLNGDISYIDVLDALTREQQLRRDLLQARFRLIDNRIALYRALAGGWDGIVKPSPKNEIGSTSTVAK